jgi:SAM-dependent methyltransferase
MSDFSSLAGSDFLRRWHARFPGGTTRQFAPATIQGLGGSSYELLVDDLESLPSLTSLLDVACGDGYLLQRIAEHFPAIQITGIDASREELALARGRSMAAQFGLLEARADAMPFENAAFDAATCHMALMLFDDARAAVHEIARVVRPGGMFAAVLGPAPGASEAVQRFGGKLNDIERAQGLAPLDIGDPAVQSGGLRGVFDSKEWSSLSLDMVALRFDGDDDRVREMLMGMYNMARLSDNARLELNSYLTDEFKRASEQNSSTEWTLGLCHVVARRA